MNKIVVIILTFSIQVSFAQDLLQLLDNDDPQVVSSYFKDTRIVNSQSSKQLKKHGFKFLVQHRFGTVNSGLYQLFGLDNSDVRIGLEYGLSDQMLIAVGRSSFEKEYDASIKYQIKKQSSKFPVALSFYTATFFKHPSSVIRSESDFDVVYQFSFSNQFILARKMSSKLTLALIPSHVHLNLVENGRSNNPLFIGLGGRYKLSPRVSVNSEYFYTTNDISINHKNMFSIGFDIDTGGHVFSLHLTNSRGLNERAFLIDTDDDWLDGGIFFGFNISRAFK